LNFGSKFLTDEELTARKEAGKSGRQKLTGFPRHASRHGSYVDQNAIYRFHIC
jgi:hypothetical protein